MFRQRVKAVGRGRAHRGRHKARLPPGLAVAGELLRQCVGPHGEALVHFDRASGSRGPARQSSRPSLPTNGPGSRCRPRTGRRSRARWTENRWPARALPAGHTARRWRRCPGSRPLRSAADLNCAGRPSMSAIQSSTCVSSSVQAGLVAHSMPCTPRPAESNSPRMDGPELLAGKKAKKLGDCQWVMPGRISFLNISQDGVEGFPVLRRVPGAARRGFVRAGRLTEPAAIRRAADNPPSNPPLRNPTAETPPGSCENCHRLS